jgi:23S rRNA (uracil1939-C5)-methyltransferase
MAVTGQRDRSRRGPRDARERRAAEAREARSTVPCPHFPRCVGCPLVGTPYGEQLRAKDAALRDALERAGVAPARQEEPVGSPRALGYRIHAKLVFRARRAPSGGREVVLGVYRPGTHSVAPADGCAVHHRLLQPILATLRTEVERLAIPIFDERVRTGALRYALARASTAHGVVHLTLVSAVADPPGLRELLARLRRAHPALGAAFLCVNPTPGNALLSADLRRLFGPPALLERFGDLELESRPDAFLQANAAVAARLYATVRAWLAPRPDDAALDLYCGVGAIALHLAPLVRRVLGVEGQASAVACAAASARRARARNADFVAAQAEGALRVVAQRDLRPTLVALNPPRKGLAPAVIDLVAGLAPRRIAYVSCDPRTLARDLALLVARGYRVERARAFDMLPQTPHVEAVALLVRPSDGGALKVECGNTDRFGDSAGDASEPRPAPHGRRS